VLDGRTGPVVARLVRRLDGMPLAIELAAARVDALGVTQLLDRIDDRFALLAGGDRLAAGWQRSLAATVAWSYQLLDERERRVFRAVSVFPGPFTLEGAEAVAGKGAGPVVLRLVDCSLLVPPRDGPDGRSRYAMLETLRAYGSGLLAEAGEHDDAAAGLAGYALGVAEEAAPGLLTTSGELDAALRLDADEATMRQVLAWARQHQPAAGLRLAAALGWWWCLRGRLAGEYPLLREAAGRAEPGSEGWCAAQFWLGWTALFSADLPAALGHFTVLRDAVAGRPPSPALAEALVGRSAALLYMGRIPEAVDEAGRALATARKLGYPTGELMALGLLSFAACYAEDYQGAVRLARQAAQITSGIPGGTARACSAFLTTALTEAGDLAAAESACATGPALSRDVGDLRSLALLLRRMAVLDLRAGRIQDAAAHLCEALQITARAGSREELHGSLDCCGHLCAATGRRAEALTVWAALAAHGPGRRAGAGREPAQRPGAGAGHPGRPGPHRRADRRRASHRHPQGQRPPGPNPGQDRLPPPCGPDRARAASRLGLVSSPDGIGSGPQDLTARHLPDHPWSGIHRDDYEPDSPGAELGGTRPRDEGLRRRGSTR
jgi:tetratricopeptide (TPR) repeat protein